MKTKNYKIIKKGFSTLFVVIILGSVALALAIAMSTSSLWSVQGSLATKQNNQAKALVNSCAEVALESMRQNNSVTGSANVTIDGNSCTYTISNTGGNNRTISVTGVVGNITRKLSITTNSFNPTNIASWQEIS